MAAMSWSGAESFIVIRAPDNSDRNVYVQGLTVDGASRDKAYLSHDQLADGATLTFDMGPQPSDWATHADAAPPSITDDDDVPRPLRDATGKDRGTATARGGTEARPLFDDKSATRASLTGAAPWVQYRFAKDAKQQVRFYTLTSGAGDASEDPRSWVLKGSNDGRTWTVLDERRNEAFQWRSQTRAFKTTRPGNYAQYRIELGGPATLAEVELLNKGKPVASPLSAEVTKGVGWAGDTVTVGVKVSNAGTTALSGDVALTAP
jgi:hypothetical protein